MDFDNEDMHGDFVVSLCIEEPFGKKQASCVVVGRPNTHPEDVHLLKGTVQADRVTIVGPAKGRGFLDNSKQWMDVLELQEDVFHTKKLATTLQTLCTKLSKKPRTKTTHLIVGEEESSGFELSNAVFNDGEDEGDLAMLPIPYECKQTIDGKDQMVTRVFCIWRAYIVGTETDVKQATVKKDTNYDLMVKLMAGTKINKS